MMALGNWTYKLSDGQIWNARRMRNYVEPATLVQTEDNTQVINETSTTLRQSQRPNKGKPPERFDASNYL
jgi:hypothetical protein